MNFSSRLIFFSLNIVIDSFLDGKKSMNETPQLLLLREAYTHSSDGAYTISTTRTYVYVYVNRIRYHKRHTNGCSFKQILLFFAGWGYWWLGLRTWFASTVRKRLPSDRRLLFPSRRKVYVTWPSSSEYTPEYRNSRRGWRWLGGGETTSSAERRYTRAWILSVVIEFYCPAAEL